MRKIVLFLVLVIFVSGCYPVLKKQAQTPEEALRLVKKISDIKDDMDTATLVDAIQKNLEYLKKLPPDYLFYYGSDSFSASQVIESQQLFLEIILANPEPKKLKKAIKKNFRIYRAAGQVGNKNVLFTGYFEPIYEASLTSDDVYKYPIYKKPDDLIKIDLSQFSDKYKNESITARIESNNITPYFTREDIEIKKALSGRTLELAYLKSPVDVAFLHIQGSGTLVLPDGNKLRAGYSCGNGRPYQSIGRYMLDMGYLTKENMSMQSIRQYLAAHTEVIDDILNRNPSYVFFQFIDSGATGNINVPLTPGRSIALDSRIFPKGALGFISTQKPVVDDKGELIGWEDFSRFVLNQDTGGAIKGAGRADIFWGSGAYAEIAAGYMQHEGTLYLLIKK